VSISPATIRSSDNKATPGGAVHVKVDAPFVCITGNRRYVVQGLYQIDLVKVLKLYARHDYVYTMSATYSTVRIMYVHHSEHGLLNYHVPLPPTTLNFSMRDSQPSLELPLPSLYLQDSNEEA
jgi:hypothetical protein